MASEMSKWLLECDPPAGTEPEAPLGLVQAVREVETAEDDRPPPIGTLGNAIIAVAVIALGAGALIGSTSLGVGTAREPRAGTWPLLVGIVLVVLGAGLLAVARRTADAERFTRASWLVLAGVATMVGFVAVLGVIGFEIPAALLCLVWLRFRPGELADVDRDQRRHGGRVLPRVRGGARGADSAPVLGDPWTCPPSSTASASCWSPRTSSTA
ncbi:MAG TPA: tripartite tricarboxylate transporter TctB family protein [Actinophytocola sp.]|uniref:tripartite tricarboxylate transporter TctB family protein n=1 Tax=Actinophytocola sp. TaxID=1872138 RepID=UPI002DBE6733|nr:tripartite tricarboxylate transporter TctB family protein [Actinophytocola sp.]HEU5471655.1 tripartite tricarboxylate transporter TctB family protein [Actinophytocola sp.]